MNRSRTLSSAWRQRASIAGTLLTVLAAFVVYPGCSPPGSGSEASDTLAVAFYNVENLFDLVLDGTEYARYRPFESGWDTYSFAAALNATASVIAAVNADIVGLCEVENAHVVELLVVELRRRGVIYPWYAVADTPRTTTTVTALLSRLPAGKRTGIETTMAGGHWSRNILEVTLYTGTDSLIVFVNHWPSKYHPSSPRLQAARALAHRVAHLPPATPYLLMGDFNENWNECETFFSQGLDNTGGKTGLNHVLGTVVAQANGCLRYRLAPVSEGHYDAWFDLDEGERGSLVYNGSWHTPDHFLIPPSLFAGSGWRYLQGSFSVFTMGGALLRNGHPWRREVHRNATGVHGTGRGYSDHLPIVCRLVRSPRDAAALPALKDTLTPPTGCGPFLTCNGGIEGWIPLNSGIAVGRRQVPPPRGYALEIAGTATRNATAARVLIPSSRFRSPRPRTLFFDITGSGTLCLRLRGKGEERWRYWSPTHPQLSPQARYTPCDWAEWTRVAVHLPSGITTRAGLEVELRSRGGDMLQVLLDSLWLQ